MLGFEGSDAVARHAAHMSIVHDDEIDPDTQLEAIDSVTYEEVATVAQGISEELAVAVVGPHELSEF